jgi:hypothetical protein
MCLVASNRTVASAFSGGGGDGEKNNLTEKNIYSIAAAPPLLSPYFQLSPLK